MPLSLVHQGSLEGIAVGCLFFAAMQTLGRVFLLPMLMSWPLAHAVGLVDNYASDTTGGQPLQLAYIESTLRRNPNDACADCMTALGALFTTSDEGVGAGDGTAKMVSLVDVESGLSVVKRLNE